MSKLIINEVAQTISDSIENIIDNQQYKISFDVLETKQISVANSTTNSTIYEGIGAFNFVRIISDQTITMTLKEDISDVSTQFYSASGTKFETEKSGTDLQIVVSNSSGKVANISIIVARKEQ